MGEKLHDIQDTILRHALVEVVFDGWTAKALAAGTAAAGYAPEMAQAVFPEGIDDVLAHFAALLDRRMLDAVPAEQLADMRVRDRVAALVLARFAALDEFVEAERLALRYWSVPRRAAGGARLVWRTADAIWQAAGVPGFVERRIENVMQIGRVLGKIAPHNRFRSRKKAA